MESKKGSTRQALLLAVGTGTLLVGLCLVGIDAAAEDPAPQPGRSLKVGVASVCVTPDRPVWMAGYPSRNQRSEGKYQDLFVKALALEDSAGRRVVIVTSDLHGVYSEWREPVLKRAKERFGLEPAQVLLNASHTHSGPEFSRKSEPERREPEYLAELVKKTGEAIERALGGLEGAKLWQGRGSCTMAVNRRRPLPENPKRVDSTLLPNPQGLADHDVPVLKVSRADGSVKAVVFLYACHPTTMGPGYRLGGDYAGYAQQFVEREIPGATALFVQGCGGDLKPRNVGSNGEFKNGPLEVVEGFGRDLSQAVLTTLTGKLIPVEGAITVRQATLELPTQKLPSREELEAQAQAKGWRGERARRVLEAAKAGRELPGSHPHIIHVIRVGGEFRLIGLSGETCVEYALRLKRELGRNVWVSGYNNDVSAYIPSARMIPEGGYEVEQSLLWYGLRMPFEPRIEEMIVAKTRELMRTKER